MKIGEKEYSEIFVTDSESRLLASITDEDVIAEKDCKVVCTEGRGEDILIRKRKLLRQQLQLLAEQSQTAYESDLAELSNSMCKIYKLLNQSAFAVAAEFAVFAYLVIGFLILLKKLLWSKT